MSTPGQRHPDTQHRARGLLNSEWKPEQKNKRRNEFLTCFARRSFKYGLTASPMRLYTLTMQLRAATRTSPEEVSRNPLLPRNAMTLSTPAAKAGNTLHKNPTRSEQNADKNREKQSSKCFSTTTKHVQQRARKRERGHAPSAGNWEQPKRSMSMMAVSMRARDTFTAAFLFLSGRRQADAIYWPPIFG